MSGPTPGPWEITANPVGRQHIPIAARTGSSLDAVAAVMPGKPSSVANARLIAAAPDLLAALKVAIGYAPMCCDGCARKMQIAAIEKAEGAS